MDRRALLVVNRKSRAGRQDLSAVMEVLRRGGIAVAEAACGSARELSPLIAAEGRGCDLVVVGGGDGTLNAALEGVVELGLPLGVLPLGTANDLALTLGIPADPLAAAGIIATGRRRRVDLGWVNGKHFVNVASVGLSVQVARALDREVKRRWGRAGYALGALRGWRAARPFPATIRCDGKRLTVTAIQVAVGNGRHFGGGMVVAGDARIDDARLDLFTLAPCGLLRFAALLPLLRSGRHGVLDEVVTCRGAEVDLDTGGPLPVNTDGEITTTTPARFRVRPGALTVMAPPAPGGPG